jgi:uracil phosphoribosyltransferase
MPPAFGNLTVVDHPLVRHKLTHLRSVSTSTKVFRELVEELTLLMAYEALRDLDLEPATVETPLETAEGERIRGRKLLVVPILRAGLGMAGGVLRIVPLARVGHVGFYRDERTLEPVEYFVKLPPNPAARETVVLDPMLATGGSAVAAVSALRARGASRVRFMCLVAAPEGVKAMERAHPDVHVYAASLDRELDDDGFIRPGLGDAGDRLFGTL